MPKSKTPATTATRKGESRHDQWWYPARCELPGCSDAPRKDLKRCAGCTMVQYCCKEHQAADWEAHKKECKVFRRLGLRATFYTDADMLAEYPLTPPLRLNKASAERNNVPPAASCPLCLAPSTNEQMTRTRCCGQLICDTSHRYQLLSFSRDFCERSHEKYTLCGWHNAGLAHECDKAKDWRECPGCTQPVQYTTLGDRLWRGLNSYNFYPLLSKDVPRHSLCDTCEGCGRLFIGGVEGCTVTRDQHLCLDCPSQKPLEGR